MMQIIPHKEICGRLVNVRALIHRRDEKIDVDKPHKIYLEFSRGEITISCARDGESINVETGLQGFSEADLGEFGSLVIETRLHNAPWEKLIGSEVVSTSEIVVNSRKIGLGITFEENEIYVVNLGDELCLFSQFPESELVGEEVHVEVFNAV